MHVDVPLRRLEELLHNLGALQRRVPAHALKKQLQLSTPPLNKLGTEAVAREVA